MKASVTIKTLLAQLYSSCGAVSRKIHEHPMGDLAVLTYHRVIPRHMTRGVQPGMYVEPATFHSHLEFLQRHFRILPLEGLLSEIMDRRGAPGGKPPCVLTFDDGWLDFYVHAYPALKALNVAATVFIPTDYIGTDRWFWTDRLSHLFLCNGPGNPKTRPGSLADELNRLKGLGGARLEKAIETLKARRTEEIDEAISELSFSLDPQEGPSGRAFLSWDEVREMSRSGLISFGSHTASHRILTTLREEEIRKELRGSMEKIISEGAAKAPFIPFCYPNGNCDDRIAGMVRDAGYSLAVTTERGWVSRSSDIYRLRRISIHQDMASTTAMLGCRISSIL